ncbi:MAG: 2-oxo acid dehydrogenase subunit E2 [Thermoplasmata archaeon]|nr:2-oxo acid dehydrogenase subunit E2 [Thermoplasmata archaeon]
MPFEFRLPDIGEGVAEGEVVKWFVKEGDTIAEDAPLVSVLTDKANVEIPSPRAGTIRTLHAKEGEKVKVGGLLVTIDTKDGDAPAAQARPPEATEASAAPTASPAPTPPARPTGGRVLASPHVRRLASEKGIDLGQITGTGPQGRITEADLTAATKVPEAAEASAPADGAPAATEADAAGSDPSNPPPISTGEETAVAGAPAKSPASTPDAPHGRPPDPEIERVPIRGLRRVIAEHMTEATHRAAHFTYVEEVDATELVRTRDRMAMHLEEKGVKLSYLPLILKAIVAGLREHPRMNATMDDEANELLVHHRFNMGIATATPDGLLVPVVRDVDRKSVAELAREIQQLSERARAGKLARAELTGSSFTITSLGALGGVLATPILNYPEVAILGVHRIVRRPIYREDGTLAPAHLMNLSVSLDHRVLDGIEGAQFLAVVKRHLEDPHLLFAYLV